MSLGFDLLLCAAILLVALAAIAGRDLFRAMVFFIVYGVFIALAWLRLGATDVALAEAAIGAGLTGLLLLRALARVPAHVPGSGSAPGAVLAGAGALGVTLALGWGFLALPEAAGLGATVRALGPGAGAENPVTAVLLAFRAWDTLLESIVLLAALVGVWVLGRDAAWGGRLGLRQHVRPEGVLASFGRILPPAGLVIGIYLVWAGTSRPGGAFQGGTVLAAVALLTLMAGLARAPRVLARRLRLALILGPVLFLSVGILGAVLQPWFPGAAFLALPEAAAKPLILLIELVLTLSISVTLAALVAGPPEEEP
ncbi:hydrogenase subunit MbhD domain-containing protein [Plastorhodobacter daqingensis]|uniref:Hydrogenase subunit MbhD domain-containing protein n=1 Tax=Plastorhodobacter daqingensis TaxID=1387281 RepID=A0ABW2UNA5_9RHOB